MKYWLFVFLPFMASAQQADELFAKLSQKFKQVRNYEVSAQIKPNIPAIKILPVKANVQFTYPNTFNPHCAERPNLALKKNIFVKFQTILG